VTRSCATFGYDVRAGEPEWATSGRSKVSKLYFSTEASSISKIIFSFAGVMRILRPGGVLLLTTRISPRCVPRVRFFGSGFFDGTHGR